MSTSNIKVKKLGFTDFGLISELLKLMKPRVMSLVIFTCAVGLLTSPVTVPLKQAMIGIFLVAIGATETVCRLCLYPPSNPKEFTEKKLL